MFWLYLIMMILLVGGQFSASITAWERERRKNRENFTEDTTNGEYVD